MTKIYRLPAGADLAPCLAVRRRVFIEGQNVPEAEEVDGRDAECIHYLAEADGQPVATARVLPLDDVAKIQRVAVLEALRLRNHGSDLMRFILSDLGQETRFSSAKLGSQTHAIGFYEKLGFTAYGPEYDDAGIPHRDMRIAL
ncbi:MAG: GNAT family N-acetyltransferase [Litoreibacter sp.]|nr:GNAT family N-acetyltransferase [Litoreibacter sp.]